MSPQFSSPPERSMCSGLPVRFKISSNCMYIHYKTPLIYTNRSPKSGFIYPKLKTPVRGKAPPVWSPYPPSFAFSNHNSSPTTAGGYYSSNMPCEACRTQRMYSHPVSNRVNAPCEAKHMQKSVGVPYPQQSFNFIQSNWMDRPSSNPLLVVNPKALMPSDRKQFSSNFCHLESHVKKLVSARMQRPVNNNQVPK
jgi:hypothetical protein